MKIFVVGGTGVLGRQTVPLLVKANHEIIAIYRDDEKKKLLQEMGAHPSRGDLFDQEEILGATADADAILNLATAIPRKTKTSPKDWETTCKIRLEGTRNLMNCVLKHHMKLYVHPLVVFAYGHRNGNWVDEKVVPALPIPSSIRLPKKFKSISENPIVSENLVNQAIREKNLPAVILRFGWFYRHDAASTIDMFRGIRTGTYAIVGSGESYWNMLHVEDAAAAILKTIENYRSNIGRVFNIVDDEPVKSGVLLKYVATLLGSKPPRKIPTAIAKFVIGRPATAFVTNSVQVKNDLAKTALNWRPKFPTYKTGFKNEVEQWLKLDLPL